MEQERYVAGGFVNGNAVSGNAELAALDTGAGSRLQMRDAPVGVVRVHVPWIYEV